MGVLFFSGIYLYCCVLEMIQLRRVCMLVGERVGSRP